MLDQIDKLCMLCRYGKSRRKGLMLVAKLDYLQYIVVRAVIRNVAATVKQIWRSTTQQVDLLLAEAKSKGESSICSKGHLARFAEQILMARPFCAEPVDQASQEMAASKPSLDYSLWDDVQQVMKKVASRASELGLLSPRFLLAGGGLFMTLSNWGLLPQVRIPKDALVISPLWWIMTQ